MKGWVLGLDGAECWLRLGQDYVCNVYKFVVFLHAVIRNFRRCVREKIVNYGHDVETDGVDF